MHVETRRVVAHAARTGELPQNRCRYRFDRTDSTVAVARAGAFGSQVVILDEPTAALGVNESARVLQLIKDLRDKGMSIILISHNMPQVFDVADRIHVQRLGRRAAVVTPQSHTMNDVVAIMTGAMTVPESDQQLAPVR